MNNFIIHTQQSAPQSAAQTLQVINQKIGFIPNVFAIVAESSHALSGLAGLTEAFSCSTFSDIEQQVILLATSTENACVYCVAGHTAFAKSIGMEEAVISAMRNKDVLGNARLNTLSHTVRSLIQHKGRISDETLSHFLGAGFNHAQFLELIMGICVKTFTNYASNALTIPLDDAFKDYAWQRPSE